VVRKKRLKIISGETYVVRGLDMGPSVQQEHHGIRFSIRTGDQQGRQTTLQRVGGYVSG
jgi:hypothetical protein